MAGGSASFHEAEETLTPLTRDMHRAIVSLMEELEAIDWYQQRIEAAGDGKLKSARICARSAISGTQTTAFPSRVAHACMVPSGVAM